MTEMFDQAREAVLPYLHASPTIRVSRDPVNVSMIRHWMQALDVRFAHYLDESAARSFGHPGIVAPAAMTQVWSRPGLERGIPDSVFVELWHTLASYGYGSVVATNSEQTFSRPLELGEIVTAYEAVSDISARKSTARGPGYFVTTKTEFYSDRGDLVGEMLFRMLLFKFETLDEDKQGE